MNSEDMILNIAMPTRSSVPVKAQQNVENKGKKYNRMSKPDQRRKMHNESRYSREDSTFDGQRNGDKSSLSQNSKKIKKFPKEKKQRVRKEYDDDVDAEQVLNVDEKKDEETNIFAGNTFEEVDGLNPKLLTSLTEHKFVTLTNIQKEGIPIVIKNKNCIIKSETGSGKTLAYLVIPFC